MSIVFYGICMIMSALVFSSLWIAFRPEKTAPKSKKAMTLLAIAFGIACIWFGYLTLGNPQMAG